MRALEIIAGHVTYNLADTYKFQLITTVVCFAELVETGLWSVWVEQTVFAHTNQEGIKCTKLKE